MCSFVSSPPPAVVPILVGPLNAVIAILPGIAVALGRALWQLLGPKGLWRTAQMIWRQKLPLAGIAAAIVGLVYAWPFLFPVATADGAKAETGDWPYFRGDLARRGYEAGKTPVADPAHGKRLWNYAYKDIDGVFSSPALVGNRAYITMAMYGYFKDAGAICCLDADNGGLLWAYDKGYRSTFSSPVVKGKYLVVGEGLHLTKDARVFCLDIKASEEQHTGVKLWEFRTTSHVESTPCIYDDKVVVGAGDDGVYCFALDPDKDGKARVLWHLPEKDYPDCETSPVYEGGKLYWGLGRYGGQAVVCVDANTGKEDWRVATPSPVVGSPAIAHGKLCVGMGFGDFVNTGDAVAANLPDKMRLRGKTEEDIKQALASIKREGEVWCINLADHKVAWKFTTEQVVLATPAFDGNEVYAASRDGKLYCIAEDGKLARFFDFHEPLLASPAVGAECVYVATGTGRICGLDKQKMKLVWDLPLNLARGNFCSSSPAVGRGHLYVGASGLGLLCLGLPGREAVSPIWSGAVGGAGKSGWLDDSIIPDSADYAWGYPVEEANGASTQPAAGANIVTPPVYLGGAFYVGIGKGLARLQGGKTLAAKPTRQWTAPSANPVYLSAAGTDRAIFFVDGKAGDAGRLLRAVDPNSGKELWSRSVAADASGEFLITRKDLLIADTHKGVSCLNVEDPAKEKELWKADIGPVVGTACLVDSIALLSVEDPSSVVAVDLPTGAKLWTQPLPRPPATYPVLAAGKVWVGDAQGLTAYDMVGGAAPLSVPCGALRGRLAICGDRLACTTQDGELLVVDVAVGKVLQKIGKTEGGIGPVLTDDTVLYLTKGSIQKYDLRTGKSALWTKMTSWGNMLTPMIVADSHVIFTTDDEGLVCMKPRK
jgi:outer membrane protein assembly factor BamB